MARHVLITSDRIGRGDDALGHALVNNFLYSLARNAERPRVVVLMNAGVRLACKDSAALDSLKLLEENGVRITACGTCLDFFGLKNKLAVGSVGAMPDTVAVLMADDVLTVG